MKEYTTEFIRNVALVSHGSAGKTMLVEAFLHFTGATTRLGKIEDGTTTADFEDEEIRRGISLSTAVIPVEYQNHKINFLDTPGYTDFIGEMVSALRVPSSRLSIRITRSISWIRPDTLTSSAKWSRLCALPMEPWW